MTPACAFTLLWTSAAILIIAFGKQVGCCGSPPRLTFAELADAYKGKDSFPVGSAVNYVCRPGYAKHPGLRPSATCLESQEWSEVQEFCKRKSCGHPGELDNGQLIVQENLLFGSIVNYTCDEGHRLIGQSSRKCAISGRRVEWAGAVPHCQRISCNPPPDIPHGRHTGRHIDDFTYGIAVTYTCDKGYPLIGDASIYCATKDGLNGVWSGRAYCGVTQCPPPEVENGRKVAGDSGTYTYSQKVTFDCSAGYILAGSREIHCQVDGTWEPPPPYCEWVVQCPPPPKVQHGKYNAPELAKYTNGESVKYSCEPGYVLIGEATIYCTQSGVWSLPIPLCKVLQCPLPPSLPNGVHNGQNLTNFAFGVSVNYTCNQGYFLHGEASIYCMASGAWSQPLPQCEVRSCGLPTRLRFAELAIKYQGNNSFPVGSTVKYVCQPGYAKYPGVRTSVKCLSNQEWSEVQEFCKRKICGHPGKPNNGRLIILKDLLFGSTVNYTCDEGHRLIGQPSRQCVISSRRVVWTGDIPLCQPIGCILPQISHAKKTKAGIVFQVGENVTLECESGYALEGCPRVHCQHDSTWDCPVPVCQPDFPISAAIGFGCLAGVLLLMVISGIIWKVVSKKNKVIYTYANSKEIIDSPDSKVRYSSNIQL